MITVAGYFAMLAGSALWRVRLGIGVRKSIRHVLDIVPRCSMMLMSSRTLLLFQSVLCIVLQSVVLLLYFTNSGFGFDLRGYTFEHPALRPVAQIISGYSVILASHCLARYVDRRERILLACTVLLTIGLLFFGARALLLGVYLGVFLCYLVRLRSRVNLIWLSILLFFIVAAGFYLGNVRAGHHSLAELFGSLMFLLLYGNNFSDLRDFAWVYSAWNHGFWGGRTYIAALISFIPRVASEFRDTWGLGVATANTVGLDPQVHPGLRPGVFGEGYFNFGLAGAISVGLLLGVLSRRVDIDTKQALKGRHPSMMQAFASAMLLQVAGCVAISVNLSGLYVLFGVYAFSWICGQVLRLAGIVRESVVIGAEA
jgi:oligosaccharide repeat unit polymerase